MTHSDNRFSSDHKGPKSKEVLEQEIFSLLNSKESIKTEQENKQWKEAFDKATTEYKSRFPNLDPEVEWRKWAKRD